MKPILFNTEMVRAILDGRKTVTRRIVKPQPSESTAYFYKFLEDGKARFGWKNSNGLCDRKPPYQPGDILYVRETFARLHNASSYERFVYKATDTYPFGETYIVKFRWHPSIHMPKEAARIFLKVKTVSVERLQDIDDDGVVAEGLEIGAPFDELWDSTIKPKDRDRYGWDANPWVWVIEFERISREEAFANGIS